MANGKHYILTRYNVASPRRWGEIRLRPNWQEKPYELFRDYCLPGIASQTRKDFEWILFFDIKAPDVCIKSLLLTSMRTTKERPKDLIKRMIGCF